MTSSKLSKYRVAHGIHLSMEKLKPLQRRRKCKICRGLTHPLAMTEWGMCQACR